MNCANVYKLFCSHFDIFIDKKKNEKNFIVTQSQFYGLSNLQCFFLFVGRMVCALAVIDKFSYEQLIRKS